TPGCVRACCVPRSIAADLRSRCEGAETSAAPASFSPTPRGERAPHHHKTGAISLELSGRLGAGVCLRGLKGRKGIMTRFEKRLDLLPFYLFEPSYFGNFTTEMERMLEEFG